MRLHRLLALIFALAAVAVAGLLLAGRYMAGESLTPDPVLVGAFAAIGVGVLYIALTSAQSRLRALSGQAATLKRLSDVQKLTVERLTLANAELRESEQRYRGLVDAMGDIILRRWPDGRLTFVNDAFCAAFGVNRRDILGEIFVMETHPDDGGRRREEIAGTRRVRYERRVKTLAGWRWFAFEDFTFIDEAGAITEIQCVGRDVTEAREAESVLKKARDRAEETNRAKSMFLATMSHEIRTPMNGVIGMTRLLMDTSQTSEQRAYTLAIRQSGEALVDLINDILDFSKIEAGGIALEQKPFALRELTDGVAELLATRAHDKGIDIAVDIDPAVPERILGDDGRMRQVLINLAGNAVKFTSEGGVSIRMRVEHSPAAAGPVLLTEVEDSGIGVPEEARTRIFAHFEQVDSSHARKYGGSGLGLAITRRIVLAMGGDIGVSPAKTRGSIFWFTLPLLHGASAPPAPRPLSCRILLITSSTVLGEAMSNRLNAAGAQVFLTPSGSEAVASLMALPADVILIDHRLGDGDAENFIGGIRRFAPHARVIVLLPPGQRSRLEKLRQLGVHAYHITPVRHGALEGRIASLLEGGASAPAIATDVNTQPLRALAAQARMLDAPSDRPLAPAGEPDAPRPLQLLLAEDNEINTLLTVSLIKRMGHHVDAVKDGNEAVAAFARRRYDLVLMDLHMPGLDGIEATKRIRQSEMEKGLRRTPVIALTASVMDDDRATCMQAGMDEFLTKPLDPEALIRALASFAGTNASAA
ncbi:MAG TPA: response regulator [Micropepsaceae bacterium]|nr:response regulator [Micropepsaceae bacterium]